MDYYRGKKVLVPGGAGFIGSHLVPRLLENGARVTVLDNFHTGCRSNLSQVSGHPDLVLIEHDIVQPFAIDADIIFNLACPASPVHYQHDPIKTLKTSVIGINNLLAQCHLTGARLVHASTSEVYGDPLQHPQTESYWGNVNPIGIRACYDEGKRAAETLAMDFHRMHGVDVRLPRIFNTYGPRMAHNDGRVVSNFMCQALAGDDITIYGDGSATRSFCFVSDMVTALLQLGLVDLAAGAVVNLGNPDEYSILELAEKIIAISNSSSKIIYKPLPQDDPTRRKPDISKAKALLGWTPVIDLDDGLQKTMKYFASESAVARVI
ncbi:MAG: SDR family oxidoreductase [Rhodobacteraceae bacterium]|nr:SDR family oxidoreductase [Paracoccaceae bacterium]